MGFRALPSLIHIYIFNVVFKLSYKLLLFIYLFIYFWLHWVFVAARGHSLVVANGGYSSLWHVGSVVVAHGL